jgi:hypothetical protein
MTDTCSFVLNYRPALGNLRKCLRCPSGGKSPRPNPYRADEEYSEAFDSSSRKIYSVVPSSGTCYFRGGCFEM